MRVSSRSNKATYSRTLQSILALMNRQEDVVKPWSKLLVLDVHHVNTSLGLSVQEVGRTELVVDAQVTRAKVAT